MYLDFDMAVWAWPQWVFFCLYALNVVLSAFLHGQKRRGEHSFPRALSLTAIGLFVLTAGGFFGGAA